MVPMGRQEYCRVGRGLSGLHWGRCNERGPHREWRQETRGSFPVLTLARVVIDVATRSQISTYVEAQNSAFLSSCQRGFRPLGELNLGSETLFK